MTEQYKIDFVIPWVDGSDPAWLREKKKYMPASDTDSSIARYRDWDILKYWFRGIEKNAPWVNRIYFITWGHLPSWLNTDHPKLKIIRHEDYIPKEYLPTFSSHTIELNLHRIEGLSEHFVYFNDDMYLINPVTKDHFFHKGLPRGIAVFNPPTAPNDTMQAILSNDIRLINRHFDKNALVKKNLKMFLNPAYGKYNIRTLLCLPWTKLVGFFNHHTATRFLKSVFEEVWEREYDTLNDTSRNKFRSRADVNQYVFLYWQYCTGKFVPSKNPGKSVRIMDDIDKACEMIRSKKIKCLCLNDSVTGEDMFDIARVKIAQALEERFPEKSEFEK